MSNNLCPSPKVGKEDMDPNVINRMIFVGPGAKVSESEIVHEMHLLGLPITVKHTCYGAMVSGYKEDVFEAIKAIRKIDPYHIFTKDRGFAPGDPRRCRGQRFGPREGFHQMEKEFQILGDVADALEHPEKVITHTKSPVDVDDFVETVNDYLKEGEIDG